MVYYSVNGVVCCAAKAIQGLDGLECSPAPFAVFLFEGDLQRHGTVFAAGESGQLTACDKGLDRLDRNAFAAVSDDTDRKCVDESFKQNNNIRCVNVAHPDWKENLAFQPGPAKKRVHLLALGDVGSNILCGLKMAGADVIDSIGICDVNANAAKRWEFEANQIALPWQYDALPSVDIIEGENLFDADVVIFAAGRGIPPVGSGVQDVRMAQYELNSEIVAGYASLARRKQFKGLYCQVSDPVDPLARVMYVKSNTDEKGCFDGRGLKAEQIQGFGLGVMNARAAYYAKQDPAFADFLTQGRAFGPHGTGLVIANSVEQYDDARSRALTQKAVEANREMRALGFKPYMAPAMSSAVINILAALRGQWHYSSVFMDGVYMGCKNRFTPAGTQVEALPLPVLLKGRIQKAAEELLALPIPQNDQ